MIPFRSTLRRLSLGALPLLSFVPFDAADAATAVTPVPFRLQLEVVSNGFDGATCWIHPRAGAIPGAQPKVVLAMQKWNVKRSDVFYAVTSMFTTDLGVTWSPPVEHTTALGRHRLSETLEEGMSDFTPKWHRRTGRLLGTGHTVRYGNDTLVKNTPRSTVWSVYDPQANAWSAWQKLGMPSEDRFYSIGAGSTQRVDLENGDILLPVYGKRVEGTNYFSLVARCRFDGTRLAFVESGNELSLDHGRGLVEPCLAKFKGRYYLTLRNDLANYISVSDDGLHFDTPRRWTFDDGSELGSYNTQTMWVIHQDGLFLSYTRKGADNDHVARHRAPLFLAQVDPEKRVAIRSTEIVLVPNKGAQLGNFAVVDVDENESWVTTSEGMGPGNPAQYGSNGRVYAARLIWKTKNGDWNRH